MKIGMKMKKLVGVLLVMAFVLMGGCAYAEESSIQEIHVWCEPVMLSLLDLNPAEYMQSSTTRALFTWLAAADAMLSEELKEQYELDLERTSYVGREGVSLVLLMPVKKVTSEIELNEESEVTTEDEKRIALIVYSPYALNDNKLECGILTGLDDWLIEYVLDAQCTDGWYENDIIELYEMALLLAEATA